MFYLLSHRLAKLPKRQKVLMAKNTYILTLDGDVSFKPEAVQALINRMKIEENLGSICGRTHPLGRGFIASFQKFEYAVGHWLQKSTENTIGLVLCSPGCFSLLRASAIMDRNIIKTFATESKEAMHCIQYDQGEDRWLCTLLLKMGYKVMKLK